MSMREVIRNHLITALFALAALVLGAAAFAHQAPAVSGVAGWQYDASCCSNRDCAPVAPRMIRATPAGMVLTIPAGAHPFVVGTPLTETIPHGDPRIRASGDGEYHACISPSRQVLCIYVPPGGV